jgi:CRP-like cAMP-binding protein
VTDQIQAFHRAAIEPRSFQGSTESVQFQAFENEPDAVCGHGAGSVIEEEGASAPGLRILVSGWAARARVLEDGRRQIVRLLVAGDLCLRSGKAGAGFGVTAALTPCRTVDAATMAPRADPANPHVSGIGAMVARAVTREQVALTTHTVRLGLMCGYERTAHLLLETYERLCRARVAEAGTMPMPLTQEVLSETLGLSVVHTNRILQQLRRERQITFRAGRLTFHDPERLASICGYMLDPRRWTAGRQAGEVEGQARTA